MSIKKIFFTASVAITMVFVSCEPDDFDLLDENVSYEEYNPATMAQVKFIHAYPSLTPAAVTTAPNGPRFTIFANGKKVNGMTTTSTTANSFSYGSVFPFTPYCFISPGNTNLLFVVHRITNNAFAPIAGDTVFNFSYNFEAGKKYSVFLADKPDPGVMVIENNFGSAPVDQFQLRFVNLSANVTERYDLYSLRHGYVFRNVGYKEIQGYQTLTRTDISDTLRLFRTGTTVALSSVNGFSGSPQQVYTFFAYGKSSLGATRVPAITYYPER